VGFQPVSCGSLANKDFFAKLWILMKKVIVLIIAFAAFGLLALRLLKINSEEATHEKVEYVKELNYQFSGKIDSVVLLNRFQGLLFFTTTSGYLDKLTERELRKKQKYDEDLRFIMFTQNGKMTLLLSGADKYNAGDSIHVNTDNDNVEIFREKVLIMNGKVSQMVDGLPF
jgi:hypothetical protein